MKKEKEIILANYIIQNPKLLFECSLEDISIKGIGSVVELKLYYKPASKYEYFKLIKLFQREEQYVGTTFENRMMCGRFLAKSKYKDLIMCKMATFNPNIGEERLLSFLMPKNPGHSKELSGFLFIL